MTELAKTDIWPGPFAAALILSPLLTALLGSMLFFFSPTFPLIALFSVLLGAPLYLIAGGPALYYWLRSGQRNLFGAAVLGLCVNLAACIGGSMIATLLHQPIDETALKVYLYWGSIFAPLWSAGVAGLYRIFTHHYL